MTQLQLELERFKKDTTFYEAHYEELLQKYPDRWVAIYNEQVVGNAKDLNRLIAQLHKKRIPQGRAFVEYVTDKEDLLIL